MVANLYRPLKKSDIVRRKFLTLMTSHMMVFYFPRFILCLFFVFFK